MRFGFFKLPGFCFATNPLIIYHNYYLNFQFAFSAILKKGLPHQLYGTGFRFRGMALQLVSHFPDKCAIGLLEST